MMDKKTDFEEEFEDTWHDTEEEASLPHPEVEDEEEEDGPDADTDEAYELVKEIGELADDVPERGEEFAQSVVEKSLSIQQTIEANEKVTPAQLQALRNMKSGLEKWIR